MWSVLSGSDGVVSSSGYSGVVSSSGCQVIGSGTCGLYSWDLNDRTTSCCAGSILATKDSWIHHKNVLLPFHGFPQHSHR